MWMMSVGPVGNGFKSQNLWSKLLSSDGILVSRIAPKINPHNETYLKDVLKLKELLYRSINALPLS